MENYISSIKEIEELNVKLEEQQEEIRNIDAETASLQEVEGTNQLDVQEQRLADLEKAVVALSTETAKNAVDMEIDAIKVSIKNINRLSELEKQRLKTLQKLQRLSADLLTVINTYKGYRLNFEKRFNKVSRDTLKLLDKEDIPPEEDETSEGSEGTDIEEEQVIIDSSEESVDEYEDSAAQVDTIVINDNVMYVGTTDNESALEEETKAEEVPDMEEETSKDPMRTLLSVLKNFEELTSQVGASEYKPKLFEMLSEISLKDSEIKAIEKLMTSHKLDGLTAEQTKIFQCSVPATLLKRIGKKELILERAEGCDIYKAEFFKQNRPKFTCTVLSKLVRLLQDQDIDPSEKALKIKTFFKENQDYLDKGKLMKKPVYRAFMVLKMEDLIS